MNMVALLGIKKTQRFYDFMLKHSDTEACPYCGRRHSFDEFLVEHQQRKSDVTQTKQIPV